MAAEKEVGKIYNSIEFKIDSNSWNNLTKFEKRMLKFKRTLKEVNTEIKSLDKLNNLFNSLGGTGTSRPASPKGIGNRGSGMTKTIRDARKREAVADVMDYRQGTFRQGFASKAGTTELNRNKNAVDHIVSRYRQGQISAAMMRAEISRVNQETKKLARNTKTWYEELKSVKTVMAGFAVAGAWQAGTAIMRVGQGFETMEAAILKASGSMQQAKQDLKFVQEIARETGSDIQTATMGFTRLAVAGKNAMSMDQVKELFEGYTKYAVSVGTDQFRYEKGLFALGQIMNKGTLMAEEVKNQLGEQVVGSMSVFSEALGMTTKEFLKTMESGKLLAEDVLPLVAKQFKASANEGGAYQKMINTNRVAMGRMMLSFQLWMREFFEGGFKQGLTEVFIGFADMAKALEPLAELLGTITRHGLVPLGLALQTVAGAIQTLVDIFGLIPEPIKIILKELLGLFAFLRIGKFAVKGIGKMLPDKAKPAAGRFMENYGVSAGMATKAAAIGGTGYYGYNRIAVEVSGNEEGINRLVDVKVDEKFSDADLELINNLGG